MKTRRLNLLVGGLVWLALVGFALIVIAIWQEAVQPSNGVVAAAAGLAGFMGGASGGVTYVELEERRKRLEHKAMMDRLAVEQAVERTFGRPS